MDYKHCISEQDNSQQSFIKEQYLFSLEPQDTITTRFSNHVVCNIISNFNKICDLILNDFQNDIVLTSNILDLNSTAVNTSDPDFSSIFIDKRMPLFCLTLFQREAQPKIIILSCDLIEAILTSILKFSYYSYDIMINFLNLQTLPILFNSLRLFCEKPQIRCIILEIISNFISKLNTQQIDIDIDQLIEICNYELFKSDDCDIEIKVVHILSIISRMNDTINNIKREETLYEIFFQVFNHEMVSVYADALVGMYYIAESQIGREIILNDTTNRAERAVRGFYIGSEIIEYNALVLINILYRILTGDRLLNMHKNISIKNLASFIVDQNNDIQKASLNVISTIILYHPRFIPSLVFNGIFASPFGGLLWIFKNSSFELKSAASCIVMGTVARGPHDTINHLVENGLVICATETITSDVHFFYSNENSQFKLPSIIDTLIMVLSQEDFRERLIQQIYDRGVYDIICNFEATVDEIDKKFELLRNIIDER